MQISKKHTLGALNTIVAAISVVSVLVFLDTKETNHKNGFTRRLKVNYIKEYAVSAKPNEVIDIAGITDENIYFKTKDPSKLFVTDRSLSTSTYLQLKLPKHNKTASLFYSTVDFPNINILAGKIPAVISGNVDSQLNITTIPMSIFTRGVQVSASSFILRGFDKHQKDPNQVFIKSTPLTKGILKENNISEKNNDGGISTDGVLHYDNTNNLVIYVFYYKNSFLALDTNLNIVYTGHTIDTVSVSSIEVGKTDQHTFTNIIPRRPVNGLSFVENGLLYNNSRLISDNESLNNFKTNNVIDVYNLKSRKYLASFYIPQIKNEKARTFRIVDDKIIVLYNTSIAIYQITTSL